MTKFLNDERVPREDGGATLHIMFHSFVILLKYEALNEDVLQDGVTFMTCLFSELCLIQLQYL